jgi:hypothetical protein
MTVVHLCKQFFREQLGRAEKHEFKDLRNACDSTNSGSIVVTPKYVEDLNCSKCLMLLDALLTKIGVLHETEI